MNTNIQQLIDRAFESYNFGENVSVLGSDGWENEGKNEYIKVVYVEYLDEIDEDDDSVDTSYKVSFHAVLNDKNTKVIESSAYLVESGGEIGFAE